MAANRKRVAKRPLPKHASKSISIHVFSAPLTKRQRILAEQERVRAEEVEANEQARLLAIKEKQEAKAKEKVDYAKRYKKEMARRKRLRHDGPLFSNTSGDYQQATMELVTEFQRRFGEQTPIWFIGSLDDAAKEAYGAKTKTNDRKMLAIYIHNEKSISANIFCSQILCSNAIVNFLSENCISWAFDVTEYENKHRVNNQIDKMFGSQMAANLRRMNDDEFPILILANGKGPTNEATEIVKGDNSIDDVMTKLLTSLDISNTRKQEDIQTELEREKRDNEISEQENAYEQSKRADQERMLKQQEDEDRKRNEENKLRREEAENLKKKEEMENRLPAEPAASEKNICQLRFRFPDGRTALRRFYEKEKLSVLFIYMGSEGFHETTYRLLRQFPRADLSSLKRSKTLKELGLKQDNLVVEAQTNDESDDESDDESMEE